MPDSLEQHNPPTLDVILSQFKWKFALVYLDDTIVYNQTFGEHPPTPRSTTLKTTRVSIRLQKCFLFTNTVD